MDWFLYDNGLRHERAKAKSALLKVTPTTKWKFIKMSHWRYRLRIFLLCRSYVPFSSHLRCCNFASPVIDHICDVMMSISNEAGCVFEYIFWTTTHKVTKLGQLKDICKGNNFQESLEKFGGLGLVSGPFQFSTLLLLHNNQLCQGSSVSFFRKGEQEKIRNG